jgi:hypothetical protein
MLQWEREKEVRELILMKMLRQKPRGDTGREGVKDKDGGYYYGSGSGSGVNKNASVGQSGAKKGKIIRFGAQRVGGDKGGEQRKGRGKGRHRGNGRILLDTREVAKVEEHEPALVNTGEAVMELKAKVKEEELLDDFFSDTAGEEEDLKGVGGDDDEMPHYKNVVENEGEDGVESEELRKRMRLDPSVDNRYVEKQSVEEK